jgi:hypothetical protein
MIFTHWVFGAAAAIAVGTLSASVQAAPLAASPDNLKATAGENSTVANVVWVRRCWWHRGHRHCRRVWRDSDYYYYYDPYPHGGFFFGPSIGFGFGGHGHHHHHGHHHRGHRGHRHR